MLLNPVKRICVPFYKNKIRNTIYVENDYINLYIHYSYINWVTEIKMFLPNCKKRNIIPLNLIKIRNYLFFYKNLRQKIKGTN